MCQIITTFVVTIDNAACLLDQAKLESIVTVVLD